MGVERTIVIAGAGIGGLTAALTLAGKGFRVVLLEKAERLEEVGAGLQISPNASHILAKLGLRSALDAVALAPEAVSMLSARTGDTLARLKFGAEAQPRDDYPYWVLHRADLQAALAAQVRAHPAIELQLGRRFDEVSSCDDGVIVVDRGGFDRCQHTALALIGADGIWSAVRQQLFPQAQPRFSGLIAWRSTIDAARLPADLISKDVRLWLGENAHIVAYPISGGRQVNIVAIVAGSWNRPGWSAPGDPSEIMAQFAEPLWSASARQLIGSADGWRRWALFTMADGGVWSQGSVALLGDAAHGMLPFAAQGAGMAIEDAAVLASCFDGVADAQAAVQALQRYARLRQPRVGRVQATARRNGAIYHLHGPMALARDVAMRLLGQRLMARQRWIYDWRSED